MYFYKTSCGCAHICVNIWSFVSFSPSWSRWNMDLNYPPKRIETVRFSSWRFLAQDLPWCASVWTFHLMTVLQVKADHVQPKAVTPKGQKHTIVKSGVTPLERELEAVEGISLKQLGQPVAEVVGRVSVVTPTTASRARFHPQLITSSQRLWPQKVKSTP